MDQSINVWIDGCIKGKIMNDLMETLFLCFSQIVI